MQSIHLFIKIKTSFIYFFSTVYSLHFFTVIYFTIYTYLNTLGNNNFIVTKKILVRRDTKIRMTYVLDRSKITQKQNVNLTSSENLSHGFIVLYLNNCIFFVQNEVFSLWLYTYWINSNLFVNVIVSASIVAKYEYNSVSLRSLLSVMGLLLLE